MDGAAWWAAVHGVARSWIQLSDFTFTLHFHALEKEMATHSSVLAWRIPGMGKPGGLTSMGSHRVRHNWSDLAAEAADDDKESACNAGDLGSIPGSGRYLGEGNGNPLQYFCLENPMDRGAWWVTVHRVTKSQTRLSDSHNNNKSTLLQQKISNNWLLAHEMLQRVLIKSLNKLSRKKYICLTVLESQKTDLQISLQFWSVTVCVQNQSRPTVCAPWL